MIVTCLNGGLGNQMFQYAAARSLADRLGEDLRLDIRDLTSYRGLGEVHRYRLDAYPIRAGLAGAWGLTARGFFLSRRLRGLMGRAGLLKGYLREGAFSYQPLTLSPGSFTYLEGYWQSWRYFENDRKRILGDLTLSSNGLDRKIEFVDKMIKENSVCLHVRLGDYVRSKAVSQAHGNLAPAYYHEAVKKIKKMGTRATFYLFSDEPQKALKFFEKGMKINVMAPNIERPQEDLLLMSACRYFVTANSSFSWWGAWLSQRPGKRVVAPKQWFADGKKDTHDLIPPSWVRI